MRIIFFGTSEFGIPTLKALKQSTHNVSLCVTTENTYGKRGKKLIYPPIKIKAEELDLDIYQPQDLKIGDIANKIYALKPDIGVVISYGKFIPTNILNIPPLGMINIHPSLLPKYRGPSPMQTSLLSGDRYTGVSIIKINDRMDAGDICMQWVEEIRLEDDYISLHDRLSRVSSEMVMCILEKINNRDIECYKQRENLATYTKMVKKEDGRLHFNKETADYMIRKIKAYKKWPCAYFLYKGKIYKILDASYKKIDSNPAKVVYVDKNNLWIGANSGALSIKTIQPQGKKPMNIKAFLAGNDIRLNEKIL